MAPKTKTYQVVARISGTRDGKDWPKPGGKIDLPAAEAADYLRAGLVKDPAGDDVETATTPKAETATKPKGRGSAKAAVNAKTKDDEKPDDENTGQATDSDAANAAEKSDDAKAADEKSAKD